jgi:hydrogenase maturation protein HypF
MEFKEIRIPFYIRKPVLALGSDAKNTVCFARGNTAFVSEVTGDLKEPAAFKRFKNSIDTIQRRFKAKPGLIACDLHPEYFSTKYASASFPSIKIKPVQHHHAHICSSMAENGLPDKKVIGIAFDGTGFGNDGTFWGAEFLICDYSSFIRRAHLKPIPLAGGERAILEPWRLLFAWIGDVDKVGSKKKEAVKNMINSGYNSPLASSMGRLFDAVGVLVLKKYEVSHEAEAAIALERCVPDAVSFAVRPYHFRINKKHEQYVIDPGPMFKEIIIDIDNKRPAGIISYRFHLTAARMIQKICLLLKKETGINRIVLSGGVFQNKILLGLSIRLLRSEGFEVFIHNKLSCSDAGISLGQAVIAGHK